ncbi:MAG: hypothetical protein SFY68_00835 [Candidatus Sumerlaeia bacterium]|nr:hypothetical protein [Candidatus Sumerlaeia bacterium]
MSKLAEKSFFTEQARKQNPLLGAEHTNGYFHALYRRNRVYGDRLFRPGWVTDIPEGDKPNFWRGFLRLSRNRIKSSEEMEELYLAGITGRDMLEALFLYEYLSMRSGVGFVLILFALPLLIPLFAFQTLLYPGTWLMWVSYLWLYLEFLADFTTHIPANGIQMRNEVMRWRAISTRRFSINKVIVDFLTVCLGIVVGFVVLLLVIFLLVLISMIGSGIFELISEFYQTMEVGWMFELFGKNGMSMVLAGILGGLAFTMNISRGFRQRNAIRGLLKSFESARRDYDAYFLTDVIRDPDAEKWITFFYDYGMPPKEKYLLELVLERFKKN